MTHDSSMCKYFKLFFHLTFFSLLSSIGKLAVPGVTSPSKKPSLVINSWVEREEPSWVSTWKSGGHAQIDYEADRHMEGHASDALDSAGSPPSSSISSGLREMSAPTGQPRPAVLILNVQTGTIQSSAARGCMRL